MFLGFLQSLYRFFAQLFANLLTETKITV